MVSANPSTVAALVGSVRPSTHKLAASDASSCSTHLCLDIDDEAEARAALLEREQLSRLVDTMPSLIWCLTADGELSYYNKRLVDWLGLDLADIRCPGKSLLAAAIENVVHPDDRPAVHERLAHSCSTGEPFDMKYRQRRADGAYRLTHSRAEPLRGTHGQIVQWYGVVTDIEDEVRAQNALCCAQNRLARAAQAASLAELAAPIAHEVNQPLAAIVTNAHACQRWLSADPPNIGRARIASERIVRDANSVSDDVNRIRDLYKRSTSARPATLVAIIHPEPMRDGGRTIQWYGLAQDIDDQVHAEEALRQASDELAKTTQAPSLAELSASIAHEVSQPLAAIVANSHACQRWLESDPPNLDRAQLIVDRIIREANSVAELVSRIRALFRQTVEPRNTTKLASIVTEARNLMTEEATRRRVRIDEDIESDLPLVAFDHVQIQQVLINLIGNGMDAMDASAGDKVLKIRVRRMGDTIQTEISDRGQGIDFPDKIFEPFFTTKEHGMGMGLAICRSIVESHGGRLWAENNKPHGATFIFTLPVEENAAS
jgi:PAS domain S-box-containing protein